MNWKWFIVIFLFVPPGTEKDKLSFGVMDLEKHMLKNLKCWAVCIQLQLQRNLALGINKTREGCIIKYEILPYRWLIWLHEILIVIGHSPSPSPAHTNHCEAHTSHKARLKRIRASSFLATIVYSPPRTKTDIQSQLSKYLLNENHVISLNKF